MFATQGKSIKCKAAIAWSKGEPLSIETVEVAPPEKKEVRVKILSTGICHSDKSFIEGFMQDQHYPLLAGHEATGIVESIGEDVKLFQPGDHVISLFLPQCQECYLCKHTDTNMCERVVTEKGKFQADPKAITCKGKLILQLVNLGTFSEYTVIPEMRLVKINPKAPLDKMALFSCCFSTGYGAAVHCAKVQSGSTCAVWGLGAVGMSAIVGCRKQGAKTIIGIDINPAKFDMAKKFGCTDVVNPKDYDKSIENVLIEMTKGGVENSFVAIGNNNVVQSAVMSTRLGLGKTIVIGLVPGEVSVPSTALLMGRTVRGTYFGDTKVITEIPKMVNEYLEGKFPMLDDLITHVISLNDINEGFDLLVKGKSLRTVIAMKHES